MQPLQHKAQIIKISGQELTLSVPRQAACGNCPAAHLCGMKEKQKQIFSISVQNPSRYQTGDSVLISLNPRLGWLAVLFCYVLPLTLCLLTLILSQIFTKNEIFSGISAIIILIPYYFFLFLGKKYFKKKFTFKITEL